MYKIFDSHKVHHGTHEELEDGFDRRRKNFSRGENPESIIQGYGLSPLLFVIAMMPLDHILRKYTEATNSLTHRRKNQPHDLHEGHQIVFKKQKEWESYINNKNIQSG